MTTLISIAFVMNYAKKVKADKGSTILSMQELKDAEEAHGAAAAEVTKDVKLTGRQKAVLGIFTFTFAEGSTILSMQELKDAEEAHGAAAAEVTKDVKLTGRQKAVLGIFTFTFAVMIVGFIPLADLNAGVAHGAAAAEVTKDVKLTGRQKAVLGIFTFTFAVMIVGFIPLADLNAGVAGFFDNGVYDAEGNVITQAWSAVITGLPIGQWYFDEASTWFFVMAIVIGIVGGLSEKKIVDTFITAWSAVITGLPIGQWYFDEASTWFFVMAIVIGIVGGLSEKKIVDTFITGAADMMSVVLIIALARGISVLMAATGLDIGIVGGLSEKKIVDTFITGAADMMSVVLIIALARGISVLMAATGLDVYVLDAAANALAGLSGVIFAPMSFLVYFGLSFLIPSTSGMATVSMPIMGPLAAELGFAPEVMVMIFSAAIGVVNLFTPTSGARRIRPRRCRQRARRPVRCDLRSHELPGLLRAVLPHSFDLRYGHRVHAHHGAPGR